MLFAMSNIYEWEDEQNVHLEKYKGIPKQLSKKEKSSWDKFIEYILPWLNEKRILGERFLLAEVSKKEAEVLNLKADALNKLADATLNIEKAKKIAREAEEIEIEKSKEIDNIVINDEMINDKMNEIENKLTALFAIYGSKFDIIVKSIEEQKEENKA
jgi:hypothetical protein